MFSIIFGAFSFVGQTAAPPPESPPLHPVESYCIDYDLRGRFLTNARWKICSRKFGAEIFSIRYNEGEGGNVKTGERYKSVCNLHVIELKEKVYTFNLLGDGGILQISPQYPLRVKAAESYERFKTVDSFVAPFGYLPTGEVSNVAGISCFEYEIPNANAKACYTKDALLLRTTQGSPVIMELIATDVSIGDDGGEENYTLHKRRPYQTLPENGFYIFRCVRQDDA